MQRANADYLWKMLVAPYKGVTLQDAIRDEPRCAHCLDPGSRSWADHLQEGLFELAGLSVLTWLAQHTRDEAMQVERGHSVFHHVIARSAQARLVNEAALNAFWVHRRCSNDFAGWWQERHGGSASQWCFMQVGRGKENANEVGGAPRGKSFEQKLRVGKSASSTHS